jgi:hypothetical protein
MILQNHMAEKIKIPRFSAEEINNMVEGLAGMISQQSKARRVKVVPQKVVDETTERPVFINPILEEIYRHDLRIDHELVRQILDLPRESLLSDLTKVIYDSMARFVWFKNETEWNESTHNFVLHAIFLLSELKAEERLWVLLDILRQDENYLDYWFNDFLTEGMWESIYNLGFYKLDELSAFMKEPDRYCYCRTEIAVSLSQIALHHPERRDEVIACFRDILNFFIKHNEDDRIIDTEMIGLTVSSIVDMQGIELIPEITEIYRLEIVNPGVAGDLDEVIRESHNPTYKFDRRRDLPDIFSRYNEIVSTWIVYSDEKTKAEPNERPDYYAHIKPHIAEKKPGRNDPCPCGSGKKYKKCCLGNDE